MSEQLDETILNEHIAVQLNNKIIDEKKDKYKDIWSEWLDEAIQNEHINFYKYDNFKNIQKIGSGGFGKIYKATFNDGVTFALKSYKYGTENMKEAVNEVNYNMFLLVNENFPLTHNNWLD